jgi:hypothetical protein
MGFIGLPPKWVPPSVQIRFCNFLFVFTATTTDVGAIYLWRALANILSFMLGALDVTGEKLSK